MNLDLSVRFKKEFMLGDLLYHSAQTLAELLALPKVPEFRVETEEEDRRVPLDKEFLCGTQCPVLFIGLKDQPQKIKVVLYEIQPGQDLLPEEEKGLRAGILAGDGEEESGGPLQVVLAGSLAVALARIEGSKIRDYQSGLGAGDFLAPGEFLQAFKSSAEFKQVQRGAQGLLAQAPLDILAPGRLSPLDLEKQMDKMVVEMLGLIKVSKAIDIALFTRFYRLLDEMVEATEQDPGRRRSLVAALSLIYEYLLEEFRYAKDPEGFQAEIHRLKEKISRLGFAQPA